MKTTKPVIDKLFYRMRLMYGSYWVILLGDRPIAEIKEEWLKSLNKYSAEDIGKALEKVKEVYLKRPPSMQQFTAFVRETKKHKPGHLSNRLFDHGEMEKTSKERGNSRLMSIREIL